MPRCSRAHEVEMRVVERATHAVEVRQQQIPIDQPVECVVTRRLFEIAECVARGRKELTPSTPSHDTRGGVGAILFGAGGTSVEVVNADGTHRLVSVSPGLFDDAAELVQVTGSGLAAGQRVVVPAS